MAILPFSARNGELFLCIGTAESTFVSPRSCTSGFIRTYAFTEDGSNLELVHKVCIILHFEPQFSSIYIYLFFFKFI